jgi:hypothetical protein
MAMKSGRTGISTYPGGNIVFQDIPSFLERRQKQAHMVRRYFREKNVQYLAKKF